MRYLLAALLVLLGGVLLAERLGEDVGFVVIGYGGHALRTSLAFFCLLLVVAFLGAYALLRLLARTWRAPADLRRWRRARRASRAGRVLREGLIAMAEGDWERAERVLARSADASDQPLLHYLGAARAAEEQGAGGRRDTYLRLARESGQVADLAVGLTRSQMQVAHGDLAAARETLSVLLEMDPRNRQALRLLYQLHLRAGEWEALLALLPRLRRCGMLDGGAHAALERQVHLGLLREVGPDAEAVARAWRRLPRRYRHEAEFVAAHCRALARAGRGDEAETRLRRHLAREWDAELVDLYGEVEGADPMAQLERAERWLAGHPGDPALLRALGRLAFRNALWGKARSYLQEALAADARPEIYRLLGETCARMGDTAAAAECTQRGLALATGAAERAVLPAG